MGDDNRDGASIFEDPYDTDPRPRRPAVSNAPYDGARRSLTELREHFEYLAGALHPVESREEEAVACAVLVAEIGRASRDSKAALETAVLKWFTENEKGVRSLECGEIKYWPDRSPGAATVKDLSQLAAELWVVAEGERVLEIVYGDTEAAAEIQLAFRDLVESAVSKSGFKAGAVKKILGTEGYWQHYDRPDVDKMKTGPRVKLGVGNTRFMEKHKRKGAR